MVSRAQIIGSPFFLVLLSVKRWRSAGWSPHGRDSLRYSPKFVTYTHGALHPHIGHSARIAGFPAMTTRGKPWGNLEMYLCHPHQEAQG